MILNQPIEDIIRACSITYEHLYDAAVSDESIESALNEVMEEHLTETRLEMIMHYTMEKLRKM